MKTLLALLAITCLLHGAAVSGETVHKQFNVPPGKKLDVDLKTGGAIDIVGWDKESVEVDATPEGHDAAACKVEITEQPWGVEVSSEFEGNSDRRSGGVKCRISVPHRFNITLESMGGGISIDNVEGKCEGKTMGGELTLSRLKGDLDLATMGGAIRLTESNVDGTVSTMGGEVLLEDVTGDVRATSQGGRVTHKHVKLQTGSGKGREVNINTMGGPIDVSDAPNGADVHTMGGDISVTSAAQFVKAKTMGGDIHIEKIDGWVEATTMGGDITVQMTGDPASGKRDVTLTSMHGDINLVLPGGISAEFDIELGASEGNEGNYHIVDDFGLHQETEKKWKHNHGKPVLCTTATGSVEGGKNRIVVKTIDGNISLKRAR